jgi:hypothetical protein
MLQARLTGEQSCELRQANTDKQTPTSKHRQANTDRPSPSPSSASLWSVVCVHLVAQAAAFAAPPHATMAVRWMQALAPAAYLVDALAVIGFMANDGAVYALGSIGWRSLAG